MITNKGKLLDQISEELAIYVGSSNLNNSINRLNQNIDAEDLICDLLNKLYGWELENLNKKSQNYPGIDLGDFKNRVCIQVTADMSRKKVEKTLSIFDEKKYDQDFDRLIFVYLSLQRPKFRKAFDIGSILFDSDNDCFSMKELFIEINNLDIKRIKEIAKYLKRELVSDVGNEIHKSVESEEIRIKKVCIAKLKALGLDDLIAWDILNNTTIDSRLLVDDNTKGIRFLTGGFGSGKSHQLYCLYLKLLEDYKSGENGYFPLFIEAKDIKTIELKDIIDSCLMSDKEKLYILVDGLDEIPLDTAIRFIEELDIIVNSYETVKALISSRPLTILHGRDQINARALTVSEIDNLCLINNVTQSRVEYRFKSNKKVILSTLSKPFCAVVYCLYAKTNRFFNEMEFVRVFIEKSLENIFAKNPTCEVVIKKLAVKAVDYSYGNIDKAEIDVPFNLNDILGTGLFIEDGRNIAFTLPVTAQWLAAAAIREKYINIDELLVDEERMIKWIHPFAMLFNQMSFDESKEYFYRLLEKAPGIATLVVRAGVDLAAGTVNENKKMNGEHLYYALSVWFNILGVDNTPYFKNGKLNTLSFNQVGARIIYGIRREYIDKDVEIRNLNFFDCSGDFHFIKSCGISAQATWPWVEALDFVADEIIEKKVKNRGYLLENSILEDEYIWDSSLKLLRTNDIVTSSIDVQRMVRYFEKMHPCDEIICAGIGKIDYKCISGA